MTQWEYAMVLGHDDKDYSQRITVRLPDRSYERSSSELASVDPEGDLWLVRLLRELGRDRWELVSHFVNPDVTPGSGPASSLYMFKRPVA